MNWKVRIKNPVFWIQIILIIGGTILGYFGMSPEDITSWGKLGQVFMDAISNPYVIGISIVGVWSALNDPVVRGVKDSQQVMTYNKPRKG